jgi:hypothetical protein
VGSARDERWRGPGNTEAGVGAWVVGLFVEWLLWGDLGAAEGRCCFCHLRVFACLLTPNS